MISVKEAIDIVLDAAPSQRSITASLREALGRVLAEDVVSDVDMPPFARSGMDGYAVHSDDVQETPAQLEVVGFIPAGSYPQFTVQRGEAAKIMTGAPLPDGADAVREIEKTVALDGGKRVEILETVNSGQNISTRASEVKTGEVVLSTGTFITPAVVGLLAASGKVFVRVYRAPKVAILATGDELVDPNVTPMPGQIRNSNSFAIQSLCQKMGLKPFLLGIAKDQKSILRSRILQGLGYDVLFITGGVSMGDLDLVGEVFVDLGLQILFEKIAIKPGKPTIFARNGEKVVFGLPGNPVSSSTVFEIIARPALRKMLGYPTYHNLTVKATLTQHFLNKSQRENYHPCVSWYEEGQFFCRPLPMKGSGDILTYSRSNSYLICPIETTEIHEGTLVEVVLRDDFYFT